MGRSKNRSLIFNPYPHRLYGKRSPNWHGLEGLNTMEGGESIKDSNLRPPAPKADIHLTAPIGRNRPKADI